MSNGPAQIASPNAISKLQSRVTSSQELKSFYHNQPFIAEDLGCLFLFSMFRLRSSYTVRMYMIATASLLLCMRLSLEFLFAHSWCTLEVGRLSDTNTIRVCDVPAVLSYEVSECGRKSVEFMLVKVKATLALSMQTLVYYRKQILSPDTSAFGIPRQRRL